GAATVHVASPVVLQARSDGTHGTAAFADPPTVTVGVASQTIPVPLNGQPVSGLVYRVVDANQNQVIDAGEI
ncbi:MAG TPA: hypothetical protein PL137_18745, partial [Nocardioides sp.]|nr:hypothetical protein [Nocardioides sp.]